MKNRFAFLTVCLLLGGVLFAQEEAADSILADTSTAVPPDSVEADSADTPLAGSIEDSIRLVFPDIDLDTLNEAQRLLAEHETRFNLRRLEQQVEEIGEEFLFLDSLAEYYVPPRWNLRDDIERSFFHDAGDYLKTAPAYFVLEPQMLPFRKTVQPYGLAGGRLGLIVGDDELRPFEHIVEPDGMTDLNDVPTALDGPVSVLPGPVGMIFGASHSVATLYTRTVEPDSTRPLSALIVDKGGDGFSYARGRYSRDFRSGRRIDMSIGYRRSDGPVFGRGDDAYHYTGDFLLPMNSRWQFRAEGKLYKRHADYVVRPAESDVRLDRDRFDRSARLSFSRHNEARSAKFTFGYMYVRKGSALTGNYRTNLDLTGHGVWLSREWLWGRALVKAQVSADYREYDNWFEQYRRYYSTAGLTVASLTRPWGVALILANRYTDDYKNLPRAALMIQRSGDLSLLMFSIGYSERAPSLNELHLPYQGASIYGGGGGLDYADGGYSRLLSEKQLLGSAEISLGPARHNLSITATAGRIWDGIDWKPEVTSGITEFRPINGDIDFATAAAVAKWGLFSAFEFKVGGSYHYLDYERWDTRAYSPEYQGFGGGELHIYWKQKRIDFWAYGEVVYVGPYEGYTGVDLGERAVVNTKVSFKMGNFRFHWIVQNSLLLDYTPRDQFPIAGRYSHYGFTWTFFD